MAFPSGWQRKCSITIDSSMVSGELSHDLIVLLDQRVLPTEMVTAGGANACQEGGGDIRFSLDEPGTTQLACEIARCELDAVSEDSRIMCYVRVPGVSDTVDTTFYVWYKNDAATLPEDTDTYGKYNVWNSSDPTAPTFHNVLHMEDDPSGLSPQYQDASGNGYHYKTAGAGDFVRVEGITDSVPGRGAYFNSGSESSLARDAPDSIPHPGTANFSMFLFAKLNTSLNNDTMWRITDSGTSYFVLWATDASIRLSGVSVSQWGGVTPSWANPMVIGFVRDGDSVYMYAEGQPEYSGSGVAASDVGGSATSSQVGYAQGDITYYEYWLFSVSINSFYQNSLHKNFTDLTTYISHGTPQAAAIEAEIYFDGLNAGTEVRVYETPHAQIWTCECVADVGGNLGGKYVTFEAQDVGATTKYYAWFKADGYGSDPAVVGRTGIRIDINIDDTAEDVATAFDSVVDGYGNMTTSVISDTVTITNLINGETEEPLDVDSGCTVTVVQIGGTSTAEIDGIETSTGTSWTGTYFMLRPRRCLIVMHAILYNYVRYKAILPLAGLTVPAGALQRVDRNYMT